MLMAISKVPSSFHAMKLDEIIANFPHENSIATLCLSGQLPEKLTAIAEAGFQAVDIFEDDLLHFPGTVEEIGELCRKLRLKVKMFQTFRDFEGTTSRIALDKNLERYVIVFYYPTRIEISRLESIILR